MSSFVGVQGMCCFWILLLFQNQHPGANSLFHHLRVQPWKHLLLVANSLTTVMPTQSEAREKM